MTIRLLNHITEQEKTDAVERIIEHAAPRRDFFIMLVLSVAMAAFGVVMDNVVVLIGSMLIAPMLFPILSLALGVIMSDDKLIRGPLFTIAKSVAWALGAGFLVGLFFSRGDILDIRTITGSIPTLLYAGVAVVSGLAASYALARPHLNEALPGVAIAVALVPPLAVAGIGLSKLNWGVFADSMLLFFVNVVGIVFSALLVFSLMQLSRKKGIAEETTEKEERDIKQETSL